MATGWTVAVDACGGRTGWTLAVGGEHHAAMVEPSAPGRLIGEGRDSLVYDAGRGRILRRYRDVPGAVRDTTGEARMMTWARRHGVPVPEVFDASGPDLVMERVDGPTLLADLERHPHRIATVGAVLAELHHRLADVPVAPWMELRYVDEPGAPAASDVRLGVVHCDLHPLNVLVGPDGPALIDWTRSCAGDRRADLAHTWIILADLGLPTGRIGRNAQLLARQVLLRGFLRRVDRTGAAELLPRIARDRLGDKNTLPAERRRLERHLDRPQAEEATGAPV